MHIESKSFILYAMKNGGGNNILALIHQVFLELKKLYNKDEQVKNHNTAIKTKEIEIYPGKCKFIKHRKKPEMFY